MFINVELTQGNICCIYILPQQQSLSANGEFNPKSSKLRTPTKRELLVSESQPKPVPFEDLSSIQLSCSKLSNHIKSE